MFLDGHLTERFFRRVTARPVLTITVGAQGYCANLPK